MTITIGRTTLITASLCILAVIGVVALLVYRNHLAAEYAAKAAEHEAKVKAAQLAYEKLETATEKRDSLRSELNVAWDALNRDSESGDNSSQQRHDYLTSGNRADQHVLSLITSEMDSADQAEIDENLVHNDMLQSLDVYASVYGDSVTSAARADEMKRDQLVLQSLSYWQRASEAIKDSVTAELNGENRVGDSSDEIDNLYEQSSQYQTQAKTASSELYHDFVLLKKRLQDDKARAKATLANLVPPTPTATPMPEPAMPVDTPGPAVSSNTGLNSRVALLLALAKAARFSASRPQFDETTKGTPGMRGPLPAMDDVEIDFTGATKFQFNATAVRDQVIGEERWIFAPDTISRPGKISRTALLQRAEWILRAFYPNDVQNDFRTATAGSEEDGYTEYRGRRFIYFTDTTYGSFGVMTPAGYKLYNYMRD